MEVSESVEAGRGFEGSWDRLKPKWVNKVRVQRTRKHPRFPETVVEKSGVGDGEEAPRFGVPTDPEKRRGGRWVSWSRRRPGRDERDWEKLCFHVKIMNY